MANRVQGRCQKLIRWMTLVITFFTAAEALAKDTAFKPGKLSLGFHADESFVPEAFRERLAEDWESFCKEFSTQFLIGKGLQGRGIYNKADCQPISYVSDIKALEAKGDSWQFMFGWDKKGMILTIIRPGKGTGEHNSQIDFPTTLTPDFLFGYPQTASYVAGRIYRRLPAAWYLTINKDDIQLQLEPLAGNSVGIVEPARKIGLYGLTYSAETKSFNPVLFGVAETVGSDENPKAYDRTGSTPLEVRWVVQPKAAKVRVWAQEIYNPMEKEVDPTFLTVSDGRSRNSLLEGYALEGLNTHTVYFRYGLPFPKGSTVVSRASKVELGVQLGKGMLSGLTFHGEFSPRNELTENGETYSYTWSRMELGYSFRLGVPQAIEKLATRFSLTPKIGVLSMDAYFPLNAAENLEFASTAKFDVKRQLDFGGEFSWELEALDYRLRAWGSAHLSGYLLAGSDPSKISNQRAGGDISYDFYKSRGGLSIGAMAFGYIDWVTLQKEAKPQLSSFSLTATSTTASGASYNVTYLGAGLSVTW